MCFGAGATNRGGRLGQSALCQSTAGRVIIPRLRAVRHTSVPTEATQHPRHCRGTHLQRAHRIRLPCLQLGLNSYLCLKTVKVVRFNIDIIKRLKVQNFVQQVFKIDLGWEKIIGIEMIFTNIFAW